jgi:capsular exopolysaccharide synthesis family protein
MQDTSPDRSVYLNGNGNGNGNGKLENSQNGHSSLNYSLPVLNQTPADDDEGFDLKQVINVVKHRVRLIAGITAGMTAAAAMWTFLQKPKYQGNFQVLVEPASNSMQQQESKLALLGDKTGVDYDTQIEVLRSPNILAPIIAEIAKRYPGIEFEDLIQPKVKNSALKINQVKATKILEISYRDTDPQKVKFILDRLSTNYLQYSLEERRNKIKQGIAFVDEQLPGIRKKVSDQEQQLQQFRQQNNLLDPEEEAKLLSKQQGIFQEKYFETQAELNAAKSLFSRLQKQLGFEPEQAIATTYLSDSPRYQNLLNQLQKVELELAQQSAVFSNKSPNIQNLIEKRDKLIPLMNQEASRILSAKGIKIDSAQSAALNSPNALRARLNQKYVEAANEIVIQELRLTALKDLQRRLNLRAQQMPLLIRDYTDLQRQLTVATESLKRFLEAQETLQLQAAQQALPWQLIAQPELPEDPVSPKVPLNLGLGLFGGLLVGLGAALLAERLDPVFHSVDEIKETLHLPILGMIPIQNDLKPLELEAEESGLPQLQIGDTQIAVDANPPKNNKQQTQTTNWYTASPFLEAFRSLNTNIRLLGSDHPINSLVISSSVPSEGKSTISSHLAQAAAAMGQRVLLIDADLRRPQVHHWIGLENERGLSNILATGLDLEEAIQRVPQWENLSILTAGELPPDPTRLLSSSRMQQLMDRLNDEDRYDLIIYDTPPILGFADGRILAKSTNGVVLVAKIGTTDRSLLKQNVDTLKMSGVGILGLVVNGVTRTTGGSYYYNRYYNRR